MGAYEFSTILHQTNMKSNYSVIIPAHNEEHSVAGVLEAISKLKRLEGADIIVVDDCSTDATASVVKRYSVQLLQNVQNFGYGYSLKRGIAAAKNDSIVILDADGSYPVSAIDMLIAEYEKGFDMVVGARHGKYYRGSWVKRVGRFFFKLLSEFATGRRIPDINSGCRVFRKHIAVRFFHTLSTGFSFTTTITLAFMLNAYSVQYIPIEYHKRVGTSKVRYVRDILRSTQIILEAIVFYNPTKIFLLFALGIVASGALGIVISLFASIPGLIVFLALALAILMLGTGFIVVFLKFSHDRA
ncbi:glycosyltransferase family 2 protein [Candidatus Kaiserbacteria bacterium]|nr:glycosyltransferase family 2 protein [Candidatus Kaiserbacteria bacterium]